jgi:hypothetical protein
MHPVDLAEMIFVFPIHQAKLNELASRWQRKINLRERAEES